MIQPTNLLAMTIIESLKHWNRWGGAPLKSGIPRNLTQSLLPFLSTPEIIALIGPRRAGKTTILFQIMDALEEKGILPEAMLHINLEEPALSPELGIDLLETAYQAYREAIHPQGKAYIFLDEIQNVPRWEQWVRARNESEEVKFFITGSSSQLMSRELGTVLTGRHLSFPVYPLNFEEYLRFKSIEIKAPLSQTSASSLIQNALNNYLKWGGFPEIVLAEEEIRKELLLKQYFDDILFKDVAMRHRIRDMFALRNIAVYLLTHSGSLISFQRLAKIFEVSMDLAQSYCHYLQEAYVIDLLPFYSRKAAERQRNPHKVYAVDLGLRNVVTLSATPDSGHIQETAVYHHLQQQSQDGIFYWKGKQEVDFLVRQGLDIKKIIQVVSSLDKNETLDRETQALKEASQVFPATQCCLIANKISQQLPRIPTVKMMPLWSVLLNKAEC